MLDQLFQLKAEDDEDQEAFNERMLADYTADEDKTAVSSNIEVPETSLACPIDAQEAQAACTAFAANMDDLLS
jgi:hypothetical protein